MTTIDYFEAWQRWWAGEQVNSLYLWGQPILRWARIGKILQFGAGLAVILDLLGPKRIRAAAVRLGAFQGTAEDQITVAGRRYLDEVQASWLLTWSRKSVPRLWRMLARREQEKGQEGKYTQRIAEREKSVVDAREKLRAIPAGTIKVARRANRATVVISLVGLPAWPILKQYHQNVPDVLTGAVFVLTMISTVSLFAPPMRLAGVLAYRVIVVFAYVMFVTILAGVLLTLLGEGRNAHPIRWIAFIMFLVGFHFDLLGS